MIAHGRISRDKYDPTDADLVELIREGVADLLAHHGYPVDTAWTVVDVERGEDAVHVKVDVESVTA